MFFAKKPLSFYISFFVLLVFLVQSCDDKKTQQFGGINLVIKNQEFSNEDEEAESEIDVDISLNQDDFELKSLKDKESNKKPKSNLVFNNYRVKTLDEVVTNNLKEDSSENQIADVDAVRVTLNNEQPTTIPIVNGLASYSRDGIAIGTIPIKVDLLGGGLEKYTQTKSVSIIANQNTAVSFNSFSVLNQQISITNSNFGNTVVQGDQISFEWTNTHAEQPVQIAVIQNNDTNIIQTLESSYIGTSYVLNTTNSNPTDNIGFKVISNVASNTSSSICCFDLVANAPQANDISSSVNEDSSVTIQLDANSPGGESVTYIIVSSPSNGSLSSISGSNVTYTPNQDYNGSDSFTYRANNGTQDSNTATVTLAIIAVNDAPIANNISADTNFNDAVDLQFDASDVDGDNLSYFIVSGASNGTLTLHSNDQVEYLPNSGFSGTDTFTYGATDGSLNSNTATATVTVGESIELTFPNGGEELSINSTYNITWNNGFSNTGIELRKDGSKILDISGDAGDVESFAWTVPSNLTPGDGYVVRVYDAGAGSVFDESDNTFSILGSSDDTFVEQVSIDFTSNNTITTQNVLVSNKNYYLKVSGDGSYAGGNRIDAAYISSNANWSNPEPWVATSDNDSWMFNDINIRQSLRPNPDQYNSSHVYYYYFQGNDNTQTFAFKDCNYSFQCYSDNSGGLTIEIYETDNTAPTVNNITASTIYEQAVSIELDGSDEENDNLTYSINSNPSNGTIAFTGTSTISYNPNSGFSGSDSFTYSANDGILDSNIATVSIDVSSADEVSGKFDSSLGGKGIKIDPAGEVFSNEFTLSFYLKIDMSNDPDDKVHGIIRSILGSTTPGFALRVHPRSASSNAGTLDFTFSDGTQDNPVYSNFSLANNANWNHFVVVKNNNTVDFYVNGSLDKSHSVSFNNIANSDAYIGSAAFVGDFQRLNGLMDEFVLWDNSLNSNQISTLFSTGSPTGILDSNMKMYYQFNANEGSNIIDHSGNNNNGIGEVGFSYSSDIPGSINVNNPPTTEDINVTIDENRTIKSLVAIPLQGSDIDGDDLSYYLTTTPENGSFSISEDILTYNAYQDWNGVETFTYRANDGISDSNTSTITITVNAVNDDPVVTGVNPYGPSNYSLHFSGSPDIVDIPEISPEIGTAGSSFTISLWIKPHINSDGGQNGVLIHATDGGGTGFFYLPRLTMVAGNFIDYYHGTSNSGRGNIPVTSGEWNHVVFRSDANRSVNELFINGTLDLSNSFDSTVNNYRNDRRWQIGNWEPKSQSHSHAYDGKIDDLAIWEVALSNSEILSLYNTGNGLPAVNIQSNELSAYYNFESGSGDTILDSSGNNKHGTKNTSTTWDSDTVNFPDGVELSTQEDTPLVIDLAEYVLDIDGDNLTASISSDASNGTISINNLILTYYPNENFYGNDSFSWSISDGTVNTSNINVNIEITSVNDAPVTSNQTATTDKDTQVDITLSATDVENESLTFSVVSDASNGLTSLNNNIITYTPNSGYAGTDSFTFKANDGSDDSNISTVSITVNGEGNAIYTIDPSATSSETVSSNSSWTYDIDVTENGRLKDIKLSVNLNGQSSNQLRYTNLVLTSPNNSRILLFGGDQASNECSNSGGCMSSDSNVLTQTNFDDESSTYIYNGSAPYIGTFKPNQPLSTFDNEEINGTWSLHVINNTGALITMGEFALDITYYPDDAGETYYEYNTSIFSPQDETTLDIDANSTGIITIPVSLSRNQTIQDLDFELTLDGVSSNHLRYTTVNVDIGDSNDAQLVFRGDQITGTGSSFAQDQSTMYKVRFDQQTEVDYRHTLLHQQRVGAGYNGGDLNTFNGKSISEFRIYIFNGNNQSMAVDRSKTKVYIYNSTDNSVPIINGDYYVNGREDYISWIEVNHTSLDPLRTTGSGPFTITDAPTEGAVSTWHPCEDDGTGQGKISGSTQNSASHLDCDTIGNWWLRYTASDSGVDSFDFKMVDIHGDESEAKTVNIFNTTYGNNASISGNLPNQGYVKAVPGTDFEAIAIGKELTYIFKSVAEVEKFRLGFFNNATGVGDTVVIDEKINGSSPNVHSYDPNGINYKFTLTEELLSSMPSEANRIQLNASANYYVYNSAGAQINGSGSYWQGNYYPNYFPEANNINVSMDENTSTEITLDATDGDNDALTYSIVTDASNGTTSLSDGVLTYTPNSDFNGSETITYKVNDGYVDSDEATVAISINAVNEGEFTFPAGGEWLVQNRQYDVTWINGYSNVGVKLMTPIPNVANPTTTWDTGGLGNVTSLSYTPASSRTARDDYWLRIYDADDPNNNSLWFDSNTFGIDVNRAPSASTISKTTVEDIPIEITLEGSDLNNDELTYTIASNPGNGTLGSINNTNKITYTPDVNFVGSDIFSYTVSDGELTATDNVILSITEDNYITLRDTTITIGHELTEPGGDPIVYFYMPTDDADYSRSIYSDLPLLEYTVTDDNSTPGEFTLKRDRDTWNSSDEHGANRIEFYVDQNQGEISTTATVQAFGPGNDAYKDSNVATVTVNTVDKNQSKSVYLNGRNLNRIRIETDTTSGTSSTAMFWVKLLPTATAIDGSDNGVIAQWETGGTYSDKIYIDYSGDDGTNAPTLFLSSYGNKHILLDNVDLEKWYNITLVNDTDDNNNKFQKVYIDGDLVRTINNSTSGTVTNQLGYVTFGSPRIGFGDTSTSAAHIVVDDYAVFSSALTENDIETYMTSMTTNANNILHYYDFNAGNKACVIQNDHEFLDPVIWFMEDEQD